MFYVVGIKPYDGKTNISDFTGDLQQKDRAFQFFRWTATYLIHLLNFNAEEMSTITLNIPSKGTDFFKSTAYRLLSEGRTEGVEEEKERRILKMFREFPNLGDDQIADLFETRLAFVQKLRSDHLASLDS